ncbi:UNVERIFIED_CONTAM: G-type lectin S-receptor-like serine/threonine-protein kinase [Sesamum angustifolium]|uniref:Receptor-like serine/threonine-protein kinase n=1 Tax=Sesamum angustifolium TaxID=2727405 RepID=A0AAW2PAW8_9LAMI
MIGPKIIQLFVLQSVFLVLGFCLETDTISFGLYIKDPDTIISRGQVFKLGFFTPDNTTNRYLGVFYTVSEKTVIWVANRDKPLNDTSGTVSISDDGNLVLRNGNNEIVWSTNATTSPMNNTSLQIQDTGNLVLRETATGNKIWDSFSVPSDVFMPTMRIVDNINTEKKVVVSAWKNGSDPEVGRFTAGLEALNIPQIFTWNNGRPYWRSGPWNGQILIGVQDMYSPYLDGFTVVNDPPGTFYFTAPEGKFLMKITLNSSGSLVQTLWDDQTKNWDITWLAPQNECDIYGTCGPFGNCNAQDSPICSCLRGFEPTNRDEWERGNWTSGCQRKKQLQWWSRWWRRVSEAAVYEDNHKDKKLIIIIPVVVGFVSVSALVIIAWCWMVKRKGDKAKDKRIFEAGQTFSSDSNAIVLKDESERVNIEELPLFTFETLANATDQFNETNLLGKGGFGPVYKGTLPGGQEIAVKRLSRKSGQGLEEFKNEIMLIAKLQHRNLVRLLGCCIEGEEKMLLYEYMPNKSLDSYIFEKDKSSMLDWERRFNIICGIARGLLYLHQDSRFRIIHRDLKASNILLDKEMNPKISDFGMARIFGGDQTEANTKRVVGTYGYMAPEYAVDGLFSVKSDVFSFGVLVLEILSGKKNRGFYHPDHDLNLLGHAWKLWTEENPMDLLDASMVVPSAKSEVLRCIQVGLLCVQQRPEDRPTMPNVLLMLDSEHPVIAQPKQPGFYTERTIVDSESSSTGKKPQTSNEITMTLLQGR